MAHTLRNLLGAAMILIAAMGCSSRPGPDSLRPIAEMGGHSKQQVHLVTTRLRELPEVAEGLPVYSDQRSPGPSWARFDINLPSATKGQASARDFSVAAHQEFSNYADFEAGFPRKAGKRDVLVFVHGYNTSLPEALFRTAQLSADAGGDAVPIVFSWPSAAHLTGYIEDRDAADFSRAALGDLLTSLARSARTDRIMLLGHSMGGRLSMETLIQLRLAGRTDVLRRVEVVLADPDIDVDLFWAQMDQIGQMNPPLVVLTAPDDKALGLSAFLAGKRKRIGGVDVRDPGIIARADAVNVRIVDISAIDPQDTSTHSRFITLAGAWQRLPAAGQPGTVRSAGAFIFNTLGAGFYRVGMTLQP